MDRLDRLSTDPLQQPYSQCLPSIVQYAAHITRHRMASAPMPNKVVFRARTLDPQKPLAVRIRQKCRQRSPKVKRAVVIPPSGCSGMEKEEEMESHLQQAIIAQKQTTAGVVVGNHVIPTPRVQEIGPDVYERIYPPANGKTKKLITFRDFVSFFLNQEVYDADTEDEEWLSTRPFIPVDEFEQIIEKLELAYQTSSMIIQPLEAKLLLQKFDPSVVDDVYDYWLQKRRQSASAEKNRKCTVLIPKVNTEARRDERTIVNPYIAFRKRLDKVQTRRKQKTEVQQYEKILRLNYAMKKSIALVEAMLQRERMKLAITSCEEAIFQQQFLLSDHSNLELDRLTAGETKSLNKVAPPEVQPKRRVASLENGLLNKTKQELSPQRRKNWANNNRVRGERLTDALINEAWLKRTAEIWSEISPDITPPVALNNTEFYSTLTERDKIAKFDINSSVDGRFMFTRKQGCKYHAPTPLRPMPPSSQLMMNNEDGDGDFAPKALSHGFINLEQSPADGVGGDRSPTIGAIRRRLGRGGRVYVDLKLL